MLLGAGRQKKENGVDYAAGIRVLKKTGDRVEEGDALAVLFAADEALFPEAERLLAGSFEYSDFPPEPRPLILGIVE